MKNRFLFIFISFTLFTIMACNKDENTNSLDGATDIKLTEVDSETGVSAILNGEPLPKDAVSDVKIISRKDGIVTYNGSINGNKLTTEQKQRLLNTLPALVDYYKPKDASFKLGTNNTIEYTFKVKVTSEGFQHSFIDGKPMTIKYGDPEGKEYKIKRDNGDELVAKVTEKKGKDDFPYGFFYIKTSKIEFTSPDNDPAFKKTTARINHKFGLVYLEIEDKDKNNLQMKFFPWHVL